MKNNIKFITEVFFFFAVAIPTAICFYIANEIFFMFKKLK